MFVPRLSLIKPGQTQVCPQLWVFCNENDSLAYFQFWKNCRQVCLSLWAFRGFSRLQAFSHYQLAFSGGKEGHTSQHPDVLAGLGRPHIKREIFWLSALNLKDIPCNGDPRETVDRVHAKYALLKGAFCNNVV